MFNNLKFIFKRIIAYFIDILMIFSFYSLISLIPFFNVYDEKYDSLMSDYNDVVKEYTNVSKSFDKAYQDKIISNDEYNELVSFEAYKEYFKDITLDEEVSDEIYTDIVNSLYKDALDTTKKYSYYMARESFISPIIMMVIMILYFGVFQYFFNGQTVGKKIIGLQVISNSDKKINLISFIIRAIILENIIFNVANIVCLFVLDYEKYFTISDMISTAISLVQLSIILMITYRKDNRGLHDIIANTKVILLERKKKLNDKVIDAKYNEKTS